MDNIILNGIILMLKKIIPWTLALNVLFHSNASV